MIMQNCLKFSNIEFKTKLHQYLLTKSGRKTKQNLILSFPLKVERIFTQTAVRV